MDSNGYLPAMEPCRFPALWLGQAKGQEKSLPHSRENLAVVGSGSRRFGRFIRRSSLSSQDQKMVFLAGLDWRNNSGNRNFILHMEKLVWLENRFLISFGKDMS